MISTKVFLHLPRCDYHDENFRWLYNPHRWFGAYVVEPWKWGGASRRDNNRQHLEFDVRVTNIYVRYDFQIEWTSSNTGCFGEEWYSPPESSIASSHYWPMYALMHWGTIYPRRDPRSLWTPVGETLLVSTIRIITDITILGESGVLGYKNAIHYQLGTIRKHQLFWLLKPLGILFIIYSCLQITWAHLFIDFESLPEFLCVYI